MPPSTIPSTFNATSSPAPHCGYSAPKPLLTGKALSQPHDARPVFRSQCVRVIVAVTKRAEVPWKSHCTMSVLVLLVFCLIGHPGRMPGSGRRRNDEPGRVSLSGQEAAARWLDDHPK